MRADCAKISIPGPRFGYVAMYFRSALTILRPSRRCRSATQLGVPLISLLFVHFARDSRPRLTLDERLSLSGAERNGNCGGETDEDCSGRIESAVP